MFCKSDLFQNTDTTIYNKNKHILGNKKWMPVASSCMSTLSPRLPVKKHCFCTFLYPFLQWTLITACHYKSELSDGTELLLVSQFLYGWSNGEIWRGLQYYIFATACSHQERGIYGSAIATCSLKILQTATAPFLPPSSPSFPVLSPSFEAQVPLFYLSFLSNTSSLY